MLNMSCGGSHLGFLINTKQLIYCRGPPKKHSNKIVSKWLSCFREENFQILKMSCGGSHLGFMIDTKYENFLKTCTQHKYHR